MAGTFDAPQQVNDPGSISQLHARGGRHWYFWPFLAGLGMGCASHMEAPQDPRELICLSPPQSWFLMAPQSCFDAGAPALSSASTYIYN